MRFLVMIALLPAVAIAVYIYKKDSLEHEPLRLIAKLFGYGALSCIPASVAEMIITRIISVFGVGNTYFGVFLEAFVVAALCEEVLKYIFLRTTWRDRAFDYQFDGIVYAVTVSLGFAALENVMYVVEYGVSTGLLRAVTSVPGHAIFGVFMGYFYGFAKISEYQRNDAQMRDYKALAVAVPVLLHGTYDFFAMGMEINDWFMAPFFGFVALLYLIGVRRVNRSAQSDRRVSQDLVEDFYTRNGFDDPRWR